MQNYWKHWIRCIIASADLPPATRHFRTWIPLASRGARPGPVQSSRCGASWELSPLLALPPASPLPSFPSHVHFLPSSAGSNHGRRRDQLHLGGAAPRFARGGEVFFNNSPAGGVSLNHKRALHSSRCRAFWGPLVGFLEASWGLLEASCGPLVASWGRLGRSWGAFAPFGPFGGCLGGLSRPPWGSLGVLLGRLGSLLGHLGPSWGHHGAILGPSWAVFRLSGAVLTPSWTLGGPILQTY